MFKNQVIAMCDQEKLYQAMISIWRKFRTFTGLPISVGSLVPIAWILLGIARAMILLFQFRNLTKILGASNGIQSFVPLVTPRQLRHARRIRAAVSIAARNTPWVSNCFPQAIAARGLLGMCGVPYAVHFGLRKDSTSLHGEDSMRAHAWVVSGSCDVSGGRSFHSHVTVGCFGRQSWGLINVA